MNVMHRRKGAEENRWTDELWEHEDGKELEVETSGYSRLVVLYAFPVSARHLI